MSKIMRLPTNWLLVGVIAIGGLAALLGAASQAIWSDQDTVGGNVFNTGSVDLTAADSPSPMWNVTAAAPGDIATGSVTVTNAGSMELRYSITGSNVGDAALPAAMNLRIGVQGGGSCDPYHNTDGTVIAVVDDTELIATTLNTTALVGNPNPGDDVAPGGGDRILTVPVGSEVLCFSVVLPSSAADALQSLNNTTTFTFDSEQTANNP